MVMACQDQQNSEILKEVLKSQCSSNKAPSEKSNSFLKNFKDAMNGRKTSIKNEGGASD